MWRFDVNAESKSICLVAIEHVPCQWESCDNQREICAKIRWALSLFIYSLTTQNKQLLQDDLTLIETNTNYHQLNLQDLHLHLPFHLNLRVPPRHSISDYQSALVIAVIRRWDKSSFANFLVKTAKEHRRSVFLWTHGEKQRRHWKDETNAMTTLTVFIRSVVFSINSWHADEEDFIACSPWIRCISRSSNWASFVWDSCVWRYFSNSRWTFFNFSSMRFWHAWYSSVKSFSNCWRCSF